ncbi:regulatory protein [Streptomyces laurentii]|uniref:Regulatory protein n=1 Tax=Streptomyces laurentii TaxID=39478 RepID=A0A160NYL9_STRLU|nr:regulatory protein [Streptomyces laurentii]
MTVMSRPTGHPVYSQTLPREPQSAAVARRLVRTALAVWGLESLSDDAGVVITELVSNAVAHSRLASIRVIVARPSVTGVRLSGREGPRPDPPGGGLRGVRGGVGPGVS